MGATGNVVENFNIGNTRIKICDDHCRDKTPQEVEYILKRIAKLTIGPLSYATQKAYEN